MVISANLMVKAMVGQENTAGVVIVCFYYDEARRDCIAKTVQLESQLACLASLTTSKQQADLPLKTWRTNRHRPLMAINSPYCLNSKFKLTHIFINIHILFSTSQHNTISQFLQSQDQQPQHYCTTALTTDQSTSPHHTTLQLQRYRRNEIVTSASEGDSYVFVQSSELLNLFNSHTC